MAASRSEVEAKVIDVVQQTVADWDLDLPGGISKDTQLIEDLGFESIDIVQFAIGIEQAFDRKGMPFEKLFMDDGEYVDDVKVSQVTDFVCGELRV
ncbi:acyl carrier protein [Acuticoccus sp. I52.16.1]|uniref:acyl carrier protein n=1 Tax=Acuticoccus sp. I52.16.1 TaxID=2928472 RepID=UPI001FD23CC1|nr:acyl carrier protein [Acuticoccus sp. I52.16.1]UOM32850.1 acyl carrier protein [Acuticoccus sp. I52.16.1]